MIPDMSLSSVNQGLEKLGNDFCKTGDADLDAMFLQARHGLHHGCRRELGGALQRGAANIWVVLHIICPLSLPTLP